MIKQDNRLRKVRDFNLLLKYGQWVRGQLFDIKYLRLANNSNLSTRYTQDENFIKQLKLAFSAGLRVHKSAVKRNRLKRQAREVVRLIIKEGGIKEGYYIMIVVKKDALEKDYADISKELTLLLRKSGVLK